MQHRAAPSCRTLTADLLLLLASSGAFSLDSLLLLQLLLGLLELFLFGWEWGGCARVPQVGGRSGRPDVLTWSPWVLLPATKHATRQHQGRLTFSFSTSLLAAWSSDLQRDVM